MKFQIGHVTLDKVTNQAIIYPNKTRKYLLPCISEYGPGFTNFLNNVCKVAVGLGDMVITKRYFKVPERHLFILVDTSIARPTFIKFLDYIRDQPYYEDDYVYGNLAKTKLHMIIIKFPKKYYDLFETFKKGKYSEMFTPEEVKRLFNSKSNLNAPKVLVKDKNYQIVFTKRLNKMFGTTLTPEQYDGELDLPPRDQEENFE